MAWSLRPSSASSDAGRARGGSRRGHRCAGGEGDLPARRALGGDRGRRERVAELRSRSGHRRGARSRARAWRRGERARVRNGSDRRARIAWARAARRSDRLRQRRHRASPTERDPRRPGRPLRARRRRVAVVAAGAGGRAAATDGRARRDDRGPTAGDDRRRSPATDPLRAAGRERAAEVRGPARGIARGGRPDDGD